MTLLTEIKGNLGRSTAGSRGLPLFSHKMLRLLAGLDATPTPLLRLSLGLDLGLPPGFVLQNRRRCGISRNRRGGWRYRLVGSTPAAATAVAGTLVSGNWLCFVFVDRAAILIDRPSPTLDGPVVGWRGCRLSERPLAFC